MTPAPSPAGASRPMAVLATIVVVSIGLGCLNGLFATVLAFVQAVGTNRHPPAWLTVVGVVLAVGAEVAAVGLAVWTGRVVYRRVRTSAEWSWLRAGSGRPR
jgi:hypothetical protein